MFALEDVLEGTQGTFDAASAALAMTGLGFNRVVVDSRKSAGGALFVALMGERVDGHAFVLDAAGHGARGAIVRRDWEPPETLPTGMALIRVDDPLAALQRFAAWWRARHDVQVVAITGSVGKTSTKEVTGAVLARRFDTLRTEGNLNNEIGLPLTLLGLTGKHQKAVVEMGAGYALGELTLLCEIARPEISVVTNVHPVHLERLGTIERIAQNKSEIVAALPHTGTAVLNRDDPRVFAMREVTRARVLTYGLDPAADVQAVDIESRGLQGVQFTLGYRPDGTSLPVRLPLLGQHSVHTALAAAAAAHAAGMSWPDIVNGLQAVDVQVRLIVVPGKHESTLIDDSYNASPASTLAALNLLEEMQGRRIAVLGDMLELGSYEQEGHRKVGRKAATAARVLIVVGSLGRLIGEEALRSGMDPDRVFFAADNGQVIDYLSERLRPGDFVLVKGSRGLHMEEIVEGLKA